MTREEALTILTDYYGGHMAPVLDADVLRHAIALRRHLRLVPEQDDADTLRRGED